MHDADAILGRFMYSNKNRLQYLAISEFQMRSNIEILAGRFEVSERYNFLIYGMLSKSCTQKNSR